MSLIDSLAVTDSALTAERLQMDVISSNMANANTTRTASGGPYRREEVVFTPIQSSSLPAIPGTDPGIGAATGGVQVAAVVEDQRPFRTVYDPSNPAADRRGYVSYPNVDPVTEMTNMMAATRAYQSNITIAENEKAMLQRALDLGKM